MSSVIHLFSGGVNLEAVAHNRFPDNFKVLGRGVGTEVPVCTAC